MKPKYKRILLKMSGEALMGDGTTAISPSVLNRIAKEIDEVRKLGVQIAIEEFGTGNMALQQLKRFPIDYIKMSPTLTQDITVNKESEAIVKMIVALAKSLQIVVIAEGIETQKQKQLLKELGCNTMQGHLFGDPCLAEQLVNDTVTLADE